MPGLHAKGLPLKLLSGKCDESFLRTHLETADAAAYRAAWTNEQSLTPAQTAASLAIEHGEPCGIRQFGVGDSSGRPWRVVARAMSEADLTADKAQCLRVRADEVWVPTAWHVDRFVAAGVPRSRIRVIPEPVDTEFFSPSHLLPPAPTSLPASLLGSARPFTFFSVFKWELRKGWDLLLHAYWTEFGAPSIRPTRGVKLVLKTYLPSWEPGPALPQQLERFARRYFGTPLSSLPPVELVEADVSRAGLRALYAKSDAFVLPTRGEGWGLPIAEAMAMGLPAIATNFSGPSAFLTAQNAHPLRVATHLSDGSAEPSVADLRAAMRVCVQEAGTEAGKKRAEQARTDVQTKFSRAAVADLVLERLETLAARWRRRHKAAGTAAGGGKDEVRARVLEEGRRHEL